MMGILARLGRTSTYTVYKQSMIVIRDVSPKFQLVKNVLKLKAYDSYLKKIMDENDPLSE